MDAKIQNQEIIAELLRILQEYTREQSTGLEFEGAGNITIENWKSRGFEKAGKFKEVQDVNLKGLDHEAPDSDPFIQGVSTIIELLKVEEKPLKSRLSGVLETLAPYGSWVNLAYTILQNGGFL